METEKHRARGLTPEAARQAALRDFGGVEQVREACRDERGLPFFETTTRDLRWSLRVLRKEPAFSATAIVVLGLGIGAVTAIAPIVHAVLLAPLPYPAPTGWSRSGRATPSAAGSARRWRRPTSSTGASR